MELKRRPTFEDLECLVRMWAQERGIYDDWHNVPRAQTKKLYEEYCELLDGIAERDRAMVIDAIGDMLVVLTNIAFFYQTTLHQCYDVAYNEIKDRKGKMVNGIFVKETEEPK